MSPKLGSGLQKPPAIEKRNMALCQKNGIVVILMANGVVRAVGLFPLLLHISLKTGHLTLKIVHCTKIHSLNIIYYMLSMAHRATFAAKFTTNSKTNHR